MRGTLENPPIILRQDRLKLFLLQFSLAAFSLLPAWLLWSGAAGSAFWAIALLLMFGGGAIFVFPSLIRPGTLTLAADGMVWRTGWRTFRYVWTDFDAFIVFSPSWLSRQPGCVFSERCRKHLLGRKLTGNIGSFGGCWEQSASDIVEMLNAARVRWVA